MDEILASIRRIISEDAEGDAEATPRGRPGSHGDDPDSDVLVLTDRIAPDAPAPHDPAHHDADDHPEPVEGPSTIASDPVGASPGGVAVAVASSPVAPPAEPSGSHTHELIVERHSATEASRAFERLYLMVESVPPKPAPAVSSGGPTLEDLTRDLLRPMIAAWLDENLAEIVRARVDEEIERIARARVR